MRRRQPKPGAAKTEGSTDEHTANAAKPPAAVMETRVFKSGNSFAVRLPKLMYGGGEGAVYIKRLPHGRLLIEPKRKRRWPVGFFESFRVADDFRAPARPPHDPASDDRDSRLFDDQ